MTKTSIKTLIFATTLLAMSATAKSQEASPSDFFQLPQQSVSQKINKRNTPRGKTVRTVNYADGPAIVREAAKHIGKSGRQLGMKHHAWCAEFANLMRSRVGAASSGSARALDQTKNATRIQRPVVGSLVVTRRGNQGTLGHVGIVASIADDGYLQVISGNSTRRRVAINYVQPRRLYAYVIPNRI